MPATALAAPSIPIPIPDYPSLRRAVRHVLVDGQKELEAIKVSIYWQTGRLIHDHLSTREEGSTYGKNVMARLAQDFSLEESLFYRMLRFAESFPNFVPRPNLTWTHYRALLAVSDPVKRGELAREADRRTWPVRRLRLEVGRLKRFAHPNSASGEPTLTEPLRGRVGVHFIVTLRDVSGAETKAADLGFYTYQPLPSKEASGLTEGETVVRNEGKRNWFPGGTKEDVYHYQGNVERVVDGDTLLVHVDLGLGLKRRQYLRLRGIDAPPLSEPKGAKARDFLLKQFNTSPAIYFKSRFTDRYDRYLSDVWAGEAYLNNALLDAGWAKRASY